MRAVLLFLTLLLAACADTQPGSTAACSVERPGTFPIRITGNRPLVEARINGEPVTLVLDTGFNTTVIGAAAAERLKLGRAGIQRVILKGIGGESVGIPVNVEKFELAGLVLPVHAVVRMAFDLRGPVQVDGLLGIDVLRQFDVELDLQAGTGALYRSRNCPTAKPPGLLPMSTFDIPPTAAPGQLQIIVELDGKPLHALLDTGATSMVVDRRVALLLGVTGEALNADRSATARGVAPSDAKIAIHHFSRLRIGGTSVDNPHIPVAELPPNAGDMALGMDYMRNRKLWFSFSSRKVYVSAVQPGR
jgi:predicted aspartyl protease